MNRYFKEKLRREDVIMSFSGVRPLFDDGKGNPSAVTRDYVFDLDETGGAPLLNIFGGKITTFRELAERGMHRLAKFFPEMGGDWTATATLPGGEIRDADFVTFAEELRGAYPWMPRGARSTTTPAPTARAPSAWSAARPRSPGSAGISGRSSTRRRCATSSRTSGRRRRRTCCTGAPSRSCT